MSVCVDRSLVRWILGFGSSGRVVAPSHLVQTLAAHLETASARYAVRQKFAMARITIDDGTQPTRKIS